MKFRFGLNLVVDVSNRPKKSSKFIIWINIVLRKKKATKAYQVILVCSGMNKITILLLYTI